MGRSPRYVPRYMGMKLAKIREHLGIQTYDEMIARLNVTEIKLYRSYIEKYEKGKAEPPSIVLLRYAQLVGISTDDLIDDNREVKLKR